MNLTKIFLVYGHDEAAEGYHQKSIKNFKNDISEDYSYLHLFEFIPPAFKLFSLLTIYLNSKQISELNSSSTFSIKLFSSLPSPPLNNELYPPKLGGITASSNQLVWNMCYLLCGIEGFLFSFVPSFSIQLLSILPSFFYFPPLRNCMSNTNKLNRKTLKILFFKKGFKGLYFVW